MKIRNRHLIRFAGRAVSATARALGKSLRFESVPLGLPNTPFDVTPASGERFIYAVWHENLVLPVSHMGHPSVSVLISKHADGQILAEMIAAVGMGMVQGSTNRGGIEAVRKLLNPSTSRQHLAVTPDGPRGPRRIVQPGIIYIASRTGMKIVCVGIGYDNPWRVKSWDRFAIPKPCSRAKQITSVPIMVPPKCKMAELEDWRLTVQAEMDRVSDMAEEFARTNRRPRAALSRQAA